jgi:alpha-L-arabinofuranosidase
MFKTGIYELKQLINLKGFFDKKKYISASLYPIVHSSNLENKESLEEKILMHFATSKSSYKRTHKERFDEFDAEAIQQAKKHLSEKITISVHDMAASDARTSVDFFKKLEKEFPGKINCFTACLVRTLHFFCLQHRNQFIRTELR